MRDKIYDVFILGAGPIGLACGIEAKKAGLDYIIIEKGCLVNSIFNYPLNMTFFSTSEKLEIGNVPFISHSVKPNRIEALEYYRKVSAHWDLSINLYEKAIEINKENKIFTVITNKSIYKTQSIIIAIGFYDIPNLMKIPGENLSKVIHFYKEPHPYFQQKVAVVGAANSSVDVALETHRKGADVTMIIRGNEISNRVKYWVKPDIENRIKEGAIKVFYNSILSEIREKEIDIATPNGKVTIPNDFVFAMTGYLPDIEFLSSMGITFNDDLMKTPNYNPETMETNIENLFLAGVVCGGLATHKWFIENSRVHAEIIISTLSIRI